MAYKTPGVYIEEITTFPPSVAAVETAIPAFIGYTETPTDTDSGKLRFIPTRITSLLEFQNRFGGDFVPASYQVVLDTAQGNAVGTVSPRNAAGTERRYYLYASLRHYYANGGGPCYIVSVGSYSDAPALGDTTTPTGLLGGLSRIEPVDEPTLLVFPDGVSLGVAGPNPLDVGAQLGTLHKAALAQCEKLQDRFVIMDLRQGDLPASLTVDPIAIFRQNAGTNNLKYGAAYYPWVRTIYRPEVHFRQLALVTPALASIPDPTFDNTVATVVGAVNISGMAGANPLTLTPANFTQLPQHFAALLNLLRQVSATPVATVRQRFTNLLLLPRAITLAFQSLQGANLPAPLPQALTQLSQDASLRAAIVALIAFEKNTDVMGSVSTTRVASDVVNDYTSLDGSHWILPNANVDADISANTDAFAGADARATALNAAAVLPNLFDKLSAAILSLFSATPSIFDALTGDAPIDALVPAVRAADNTVVTVVGAVNISAMAGANPLSLSRANFARLPEHFAALLDLLRQVPATPVATVRERFANLLLLPRAIALTFRTLQGAALPPTLSLALTQLSRDNDLAATIVALIALEKNTNVMGSVSTTRAVADVVSDYANLNSSPWILPNANVDAIPANTTAFAGADARAKALSAAAALPRFFDKLAAAILSLFSAAEFLAGEAEKQLFEKHPVFNDIAEQVNRTMTLLPASGAVAGVYAAVDRTRGVWKAPANVSLADISGPAVKINDQIQDDLNVTSTGKSVNALRAFTGKGTLVWGARTLAGNDNEWRYIPVRRFFNMAEESIKKATEPFVFEPNDRNTWVRVRAMIENFLTVQWRQGALAGAVPQQAFFVKVGLGETMTAQDILEGRMIVEVGMAVARPAEFIILRFAHKMQTS